MGKMLIRPRNLFKNKSNGSFKARRRNAIAKYHSPDGWKASAKHNESLSKHLQRSRSWGGEYDWENLNDDQTDELCEDYDWKPLADALHRDDTSDSTILAVISEQFRSDAVLHEAIKYGAPDNVLVLLGNRFPLFHTQVDENDRSLLHSACMFGASSTFVSHCIDMNPSSAASKDVEGKTPVHLLTADTWRGRGKAKASIESEKNKEKILWQLYRQAPTSVVSEDNYGVGPVEHAIESGQCTIKFILLLQDMSKHYRESEARKVNQGHDHFEDKEDLLRN
ncbi:hypothetical protein ACHAWF_018530 [Thalassiosira exigua]